jgi:hypothetical protein
MMACSKQELNLMRFHFTTAQGKKVPVELDDDILKKIPSAPKFCIHELEHAFSWDRRVPDVWRYTLQVRPNKKPKMQPVAADTTITSRYADRPALDALCVQETHLRDKTAVAMRVLLLLLESPHADEYDLDENGRRAPLAPAQNRGVQGAGRGIDKCWQTVIRQLDLAEGDYLVIIANPVPYQCSLSTVMPRTRLSLKTKEAQAARDHVWESLFALEFMKTDFEMRLLSYEPDIILNCCTDKLQGYVTEVIQGLFKELSADFPSLGKAESAGLTTRLFSTRHPASHWHFKKNKGIQVYEHPLPKGDPVPLEVKPRPPDEEDETPAKPAKPKNK